MARAAYGDAYRYDYRYRWRYGYGAWTYGTPFAHSQARRETVAPGVVVRRPGLRMSLTVAYCMSRTGLVHAYCTSFLEAVAMALCSLPASLFCRKRPTAVSMSVWNLLLATTPCQNEPASLSVCHWLNAQAR